MKSNYFRLVPYISITWIIALLIFPLLRYQNYQISISKYYSFWIWGYPYIPIIGGINVLDIILKVLTLWFIIELILNIQSIFRLYKGEQYFDSLSERWFKWGIINFIVLIFWLLWYFFIMNNSFINPMLQITFLDIGFYLTVTYSLFLILSRILYKKYFISKYEKEDYTNLVWLKKQIYELNRSIQEIANEQNTSVMTIKNWIKKIDSSES